MVQLRDTSLYLFFFLSSKKKKKLFSRYYEDLHSSFYMNTRFFFYDIVDNCRRF